MRAPRSHTQSSSPHPFDELSRNRWSLGPHAGPVKAVRLSPLLMVQHVYPACPEERREPRRAAPTWANSSRASSSSYHAPQNRPAPPSQPHPQSRPPSGAHVALEMAASFFHTAPLNTPGSNTAQFAPMPSPTRIFSRNIASPLPLEETVPTASAAAVAPESRSPQIPSAQKVSQRASSILTTA